MNPMYQNQEHSRSLWLSISGGLFLLLGLCLCLTNPNQNKYEKFATEQLVNYARENVCQAKSANLQEAIKSQMCTLMLETGKNQIPRLIGETTERENYLLLSTYETNLYIYRFETVGIFNQFFVVNVDQLEE